MVREDDQALTNQPCYLLPSEFDASKTKNKSNQIISEEIPLVFDPPSVREAETQDMSTDENDSSVVGEVVGEVVSAIVSEPSSESAPPTMAIVEPTSNSTAQPLKVGARVIWSNAPAHVASWNPFTITSINGDTAMIDIYAYPVLLTELLLVE